MAFKVPQTTTPEEVAARLNNGEKLYMLDVREPEEWEDGHVAGALHIPLGSLSGRVHELDAKQEVIVICRSGHRSGMACEWLSEQGFNAINMVGGLNHWTGELV